jgi:predicted RNA polymerase sigma factor
MSQRLAMLDKLIAKGSTDPFVYYARAMELQGSGDAEQALAAFEEVRTRFASYVPTYLMGGQLAAKLGRVEVARAFFQQGIAVAQAAGDEHAGSELGTALSSLP